MDGLLTATHTIRWNLTLLYGMVRVVIWPKMVVRAVQIEPHCLNVLHDKPWSFNNKIWNLYHTETVYLCYLSILPTWESLTCCLTSISIWMVSGWRLAHRSDIVSWPPEKICSTATAESGECISVHATYDWYKWKKTYQESSINLEQDSTGLETELAVLPTTREVCRHRNPHLGVWNTPQVCRVMIAGPSSYILMWSWP